MRAHRTRRPVILLGVCLAIDLAMVWSAKSSDARDPSGFAVWASLVLALACTSGLVAEYGLRRCADVAAIATLSWRSVLRPLTGLAVLAAALIVGGLLAPSGARGLPWRGSIIATVGLCASAPAAAAMHGVAATSARLAGQPIGARLQNYRTLSRIARSLLPGLGALVALATFGFAAAQQASSGNADARTTQVLIFGVTGTILIGLAYAQPQHALQQEARALADQLVPLHNETDPLIARETLVKRIAVEQQLGVDASIFADLQTGIVVVAPLLSATIAAFIARG